MQTKKLKKKGEVGLKNGIECKIKRVKEGLCKQRKSQLHTVQGEGKKDDEMKSKNRSGKSGRKMKEKGFQLERGRERETGRGRKRREKNDMNEKGAGVVKVRID